MATHEDLAIHMIQVRHSGGTLKLKVDSPNDTVLKALQGKNGEKVLLDCQAKDVAEWAKKHEGFEATFATIRLPEINLDVVIDNPGFRTDLNLGAVCDTGALWTEVRASGGVGTVFTHEDIAEVLRQDFEQFEELEASDQKAFIDENMYTFTHRLEDTLSERGNNFITDRVADEFDDAFEEFQKARLPQPIR